MLYWCCDAEGSSTWSSFAYEQPKILAGGWWRALAGVWVAGCCIGAVLLRALAPGFAVSMSSSKSQAGQGALGLWLPRPGPLCLHWATSPGMDPDTAACPCSLHLCTRLRPLDWTLILLPCPALARPAPARYSGLHALGGATHAAAPLVQPSDR